MKLLSVVSRHIDNVRSNAKFQSKTHFIFVLTFLMQVDPLVIGVREAAHCPRLINNTTITTCILKNYLLCQQ